MLGADAFILEYQLTCMCQDDFMERVLVPFKDRVCFNFSA